MRFRASGRSRCAFIVLAAIFVFIIRILSPIRSVGHSELRVQRQENLAALAENTVYLTYDDGPSRNTQPLLTVLREENVPATFFVMGTDDERYTELYAKILEDGHSLGLHSYSHDYGEIFSSPESFIADLARLDALIFENTGVHPSIMRFPGGSKNRYVPTDRMREIVREVTQRGYVCFDWNAVSGDDTATVYAPETLCDNVLRQAKGKSSVVVLLHDAALCRTTPEASRLIIRHFKEQGYAFGVLDENTLPLLFAN